MINFVQSDCIYKKVINKFIEPILPYLDKYGITYDINLECKNNAVNVLFFVEEGFCKKVKMYETNGINIVMIHGIADKGYRNFASVNKFDYVFTNGDLWVKKYISQGLNPEKILLNGYTRIEETYNNRHEYIKKYNNGKKTILLAPTHTNCVTTNNKLNEIMDTLKDRYNIIESPHPYNKESIEPTGEEYLEADVVIVDFGSSIYESWTFDKPVVFADWIEGKPTVFKNKSIRDIAINGFKGSFESYIYESNIGRHALNETMFSEMIEDACINGITQKERDFIDGIFNKNLRGDSGRVTASFLLEIHGKLK